MLLSADNVNFDFILVMWVGGKLAMSVWKNDSIFYLSINDRDDENLTTFGQQVKRTSAV